MTEVPEKYNDCFEWGNRESNGQVVQRDLFFYQDGKTYTITVTTPTYLEEIKERNLQIEDPDLKEDTRVFTLDDISKVEDICRKLHQTPFEILRPFLGEQESTTGNGDQMFDPDKLDLNY